MPSPFSTDRRELCQHVDYRVGCLSCCAQDAREDLKEANTEKRKREGAIEGYQALLKKSDVRGAERDGFKEKLERATKQHAAWDERCQVLMEMVASIEGRVKDVCAGTDPNRLSEAFESNAMEREDKLRQVWRNAAKTEVEDGFVLFHPEDPKCELSFKGLDRSNIPATPDSLVSEDVGLQVFLEAGKNLQRLPSNAVGDQTGPTIMSYGRAIEMFGVPPEPGKDWRQKSEPSAELSIENRVAQMDITTAPPAADRSEPRTEYDYRQVSWQPPTAPLLSEDQQWALLGSKEHMADAAILARQYAKLVVEKEGKKSKQHSKSSTTDPVVPGSSTDASTNSEGWPPVDQLDWAGFTNWISRCNEVDKLFGRETLPSWRTQRDQRLATLVDHIKAWKAPEGFDDGSSKHPDPRKYYSGPSLGLLDMEKLGMETETTKR